MNGWLTMIEPLQIRGETMNIRNVQLTVTRQQYSNLESAADLVRTDVIELLGVEGLDQDTSAKINQLMADVDQMCQQMHYLAEVSI